MIYPTLTDQDERNYLRSLGNAECIGIAHTRDESYYCRVLRYKYPQCIQVQITETTFWVQQPGISKAPVQLTQLQCTRNKIFDALDRPLAGKKITKRIWIITLIDEGLFPNS